MIEFCPVCSRKLIYNRSGGVYINCILDIGNTDHKWSHFSISSKHDGSLDQINIHDSPGNSFHFVGQYRTIRVIVGCEETEISCHCDSIEMLMNEIESIRNGLMFQ